MRNICRNCKCNYVIEKVQSMASCIKGKCKSKQSTNMQPAQKPDKTIRVTVVGDTYTGKTCLLTTYRDKTYNDGCIPTVCEPYSVPICMKDQVYNLILQDSETVGEEFDKLRRLGDLTTDVFIICYSINNRLSFMNVEKWCDEVRSVVPNCKIILVATKVDRRNEMDNLLTVTDGHKMQTKMKAFDILECSSKKLFNINTIFRAVVTAYASSH